MILNIVAVEFLLQSQENVYFGSLNRNKKPFNTKSKFQTKNSHKWGIKYLLGDKFDQKLGVFTY